MEASNPEIEEILKSLSLYERKILPYISLGNIEEIERESKLDRTSIIRALEFLSNKGIVKLSITKEKRISLGVNGILYLKEGLPERKLLNLLSETAPLTLQEAKEKSDLSENEFKAALGVLKRKAFIKLEAGKIILEAKKSELSKKMLEEAFLERLPLKLQELNPEEKYSLEQLKNRKEIIKIEDVKNLSFGLTELGKKLEKSEIKTDLLEQLTPEMLRKKTWRGKQFRKYDIISKLPRIYGGRRQPYLEFLQEVREKLVALGFEEMTGSLVESEFWNFDALFQPQFHVAREWSSTYYVKNKLKPESIDKKILMRVKQQHEKSWKYKWQLHHALKLILRPQGTVLSARQLTKAKIPGKYFAIARCYRPDVVDAKHLSEFNQVEGIIIKENLTLRNLFSILEMFAREIAQAKEIKFVPSYFPFTEPSCELLVKHPKLSWIEAGGAGIFRREVVKPLLGKDITVLAWGLGIDRLAMNKLGVDDIRELFSQDLDFLRGVK
jgi:phenylalanyl-tRNA synthetase alpha chain